MSDFEIYKIPKAQISPNLRFIDTTGYKLSIYKQISGIPWQN
jgi:hypothetical protein